MGGSHETQSGHIFISYVHEDTETVSRLATELGATGAEVWLDRDRLKPGERWRVAIREAIEHGMFFVACFSENSAKRDRSHMNEELTIAIDELRRRPRDRAWFLPVLLSPGTLPNRGISESETLSDLQYVELHADWEAGVGKLLSVISPQVSEQAKATASAQGSQFKRPVSSSYLIGKKLFETFIEKSLDTADQKWDEITRLFESGQVLPPRCLYETESGAASWIRLCQDPSFRSYHNEVMFWQGQTGREVAVSIAEQLGRDDFDYVSLGCGTGEKDANLLRHWLGAGADITYYPYDISFQLLSSAVQRVVERLPQGQRDRLYIKASLGDFGRLERMVDAFRQRPSPNVFAVLGNSLGSLGEEHRFLRLIREQMSSEDLLILEVRLNSGEVTVLESDQELRFYFNPLHESGIPFDPNKMRVSSADHISSIPQGVTQVIEYLDFEIDGKLFDAVALGSVHSYSADAFLATLRGLGLDVVLSWNPVGSDDSSLVCVAQKIPRS